MHHSSRTVVVSSSSVFKGHATDGMIPEIPARAAVIHNALLSEARLPNLRTIAPARAADDVLSLNHARSYIEALRSASASGEHRSGDNPILKGTFEAAQLAAGSVVAAIDAIIKGDAHNGFCAVRPPGHHAFRSKWEGFCYFNNVAIGARYLMEQYNLSRVMIFDWDLHHGNGTQAAFYDDPHVLFISFHGDPSRLYPGSGFRGEKGSGDGTGYTLNVPLPKGSGDEVMKDRFIHELMPAVRKFEPEFVLISAGFDAHVEDPYRYLEWSDEGYRWLTEQTLDIADKYCHGRYLSVLEGGYNLEILKRVVPAHVDLLIERAQRS